MAGANGLSSKSGPMKAKKTTKYRESNVNVIRLVRERNGKTETTTIETSNGMRGAYLSNSKGLMTERYPGGKAAASDGIRRMITKGGWKVLPNTSGFRDPGGRRRASSG